jgi:hypothetical protein
MHCQVLLERVFCIVQLVCEVLLILDHAVTVSPILMLRHYSELCAAQPGGDDDDEPVHSAATAAVAAAAPPSALALARRPEGLLVGARLLLRDKGLLWRASATLVTGFVAGRCASTDGLQQQWEPVLLILLLCNGLRQSRTVDMIRSGRATERERERERDKDRDRDRDRDRETDI